MVAWNQNHFKTEIKLLYQGHRQNDISSLCTNSYGTFEACQPNNLNGIVICHHTSIIKHDYS